MTGIKVVIGEGVNTKTFPEAVLSGDVKLYRVRSNGTTRRIPVISGDDLETAREIKARFEAGESVRQIANDRHESVATVRRWLQELELAERVLGLNRSGIIRVFKEREL